MAGRMEMRVPSPPSSSALSSPLLEREKASSSREGSRIIVGWIWYLTIDLSHSLLLYKILQNTWDYRGQEGQEEQEAAGKQK